MLTLKYAEFTFPDLEIKFPVLNLVVNARAEIYLLMEYVGVGFLTPVR